MYYLLFAMIVFLGFVWPRPLSCRKALLLSSKQNFPDYRDCTNLHISLCSFFFGMLKDMHPTKIQDFQVPCFTFPPRSWCSSSLNRAIAVPLTKLPPEICGVVPPSRPWKCHDISSYHWAHPKLSSPKHPMSSLSVRLMSRNWSLGNGFFNHQLLNLSQIRASS